MPRAKSTTKKTSTKKTASKAKVAPKTTAKTTKTADASCTPNGSHATVYLLLAVIILLQLITLFGGGAKKAITQMEALKVGGPQNLEKLMEIYESDKYMEFQEKSIEQLEKSIDAGNPTAAAPTPTPSADNNDAAPTPTAAPAANQLDDAKLEEFVSNLRIDGNEDAEIVIVEYSDHQCPFCQRHFAQGTLKIVADKYDGQVATAFKHFPLSFHQQAEPSARAAECVYENAGTDAFNAFNGEILTTKNLSKDGLLAAAEKVGADRSAVETCFDNGDHADEVRNQMAEGQSLFGVRGTPGNVVLNKVTGEWKLVSGAQGPAAFEAAINELLQ